MKTKHQASPPPPFLLLRTGVYTWLDHFPLVLPGIYVAIRHVLRLKLLLQDALERLGVSCKLTDALAQLLYSHLFLVEVEAEQRLVIDVRLPLDVERRGSLGVELLGHGLGRVHVLIKQGGLLWWVVGIALIWLWQFRRFYG